MSEIYPVDDLEWENNSVGNDIREAILHLPELDDEEYADLLETLNESGLADQRPVAALIGLAPDADSFCNDLHVGELKTLLALAIGDEEATRERCDWIRHFEQLDAERRRVYSCIESLLKLCDAGEYEPYRAALEHLYGAAALCKAEALIKREERFFGAHAPGMLLEGCDMHQRLLAAYEKVHRSACGASIPGWQPGCPLPAWGARTA